MPLTLESRNWCLPLRTRSADSTPDSLEERLFSPRRPGNTWSEAATASCSCGLRIGIGIYMCHSPLEERWSRGSHPPRVMVHIPMIPASKGFQSSGSAVSKWLLDGSVF